MAVSLECRGLYFSYRHLPVLKNLSLRARAGRFCAVLGRNGSGKTTLLHCLNRTLTADTGTILIHGKDIGSMSQNRIARKISLVPQEHMDIFPYRVLDVVVMGRAPFLKISQQPGPWDYEIAQNSLNCLNAGSLAMKNFNRISGGERQIVLLARALTQASHIMLLDEPTNHLDFNNQYHLLSSIRSLCRVKNLCIIASMHDPNMAALFADDVIMISKGSIMACGPSEEVMTERNISDLYGTCINSVQLTAGKEIFFPDNIFRNTDQ